MMRWAVVLACAAVVGGDASAKMTATQTVFNENVDRLRQYVKRHKLPLELRERLLLYYQVRYPDGRFFDDRAVIEDAIQAERQRLGLEQE